MKDLVWVFTNADVGFFSKQKGQNFGDNKTKNERRIENKIYNQKSK